MQTIVYAGYSSDKKIQMQSSSGGLFTVVAELILQEGGSVFAACYDEDMQVVHRELHSIEELKNGRGSKYVCSKLGDTFRNIFSRLSEGRKVLFVGTPCQCAGLLACVTDTENLICVDFICHGVPGRKAWNLYLKAMAKRGKQLCQVNMRDKQTGWLKYQWCMRDIHGTVITEPHEKNIYMKGFLTDLYLRPSCYQCSFKGIERKTDLTLGDYWGILKIQPQIYNDKGVSICMIHTQKGRNIWQKVVDSCVCERAPIEKVVQCNPSIVHSAKYNKYRDKFFERIMQDEDFIDIVKDLTKVSIAKKIKRKGISYMRKVMHEILRGVKPYNYSRSYIQVAAV